ncbi:MAG TPA: tetratricopeptide repeat protein, partial [Chloroflexota bacterium]|nr:tetratricopeptide repeat protein [Chloroflexota bacterium]
LERRLGNVEQARRHYDAALPLYEAEQDRLGKANTLKSLGDLERRLGNVEQARRHYDAAQLLFELEQDPMGRMNVWVGLARLNVSEGNIELAQELFQRVFALAEERGFGDHPVTQNLRQEYAQLGQSPTLSPEALAFVQSYADLLDAWVQTPDWAQSQAFLAENEAQLLTDEAEAVLALLQEGNPESQTIPLHRTLLRRCREVGIAPAYQEMQTASAAAQDPAALALAALLQVDSAESLEAALSQHPTLLELPTLERLAAFVADSAANQPDAARHLLVRLLALLQRYNDTHTSNVDLGEQARFVALPEALLEAAAALPGDLAGALRQTLGWALNTWGNALAEQGDHAAAVATYSRAIGHAPDNAMLYRNRAGERLELGEVDEAEADINQAANLEPDAPRLADLRQTLAQKRT